MTTWNFSPTFPLNSSREMASSRVEESELMMRNRRAAVVGEMSCLSCDSASRNELCVVVDDLGDVGVGDAAISCDEGVVFGEYFFAFGAAVTALLVDDLFSRM